MTLDIISREAWGARPPDHTRAIPTPTPELWLHHTAGALDQNGNGVWWDDMRSIQAFHMDVRGWSDIAYSFVIGGGRVYEGRGAGIAGGHTKGHNTISHAICLIGNYEWMVPRDHDILAIVDLMRHGRERGWWGELTGDHSQASGANTSCCGANLRAWIPRLRKMAGEPTPTPGPTPIPTPILEDSMSAYTVISPESGQTWLVEPTIMTLVPPTDRDNVKALPALGKVSDAFFKRIDAGHKRIQ